MMTQEMQRRKKNVRLPEANGMTIAQAVPIQMPVLVLSLVSAG